MHCQCYSQWDKVGGKQYKTDWPRNNLFCNGIVGMYLLKFFLCKLISQRVNSY